MRRREFLGGLFAFPFISEGFGGMGYPGFGKTGWTPKKLPNLELWLDEPEGSNVTLSGSDITTWHDRSGKDNDVTAVNSPVQVLAAQNGRAGADYDSTNDKLSISNADADNGVDDLFVGGGMVSMVLRPDDDDALNRIIEKRGANGNTEGWFILYVPDGGGNWGPQLSHTGFTGGDTNRAVVDDDKDIALGTPVILTAHFDTDTPTTPPVLRINGAVRTVTASGTGTGSINTDGGSGGSLAIGNVTADVTRTFGGPLFEIVFTSSVPSAGALAQLESYYSNKWGIALPI